MKNTMLVDLKDTLQLKAGLIKENINTCEAFLLEVSCKNIGHYGTSHLYICAHAMSTEWLQSAGVNMYDYIRGRRRYLILHDKEARKRRLKVIITEP